LTGPCPCFVRAAMPWYKRKGPACKRLTKPVRQGTMALLIVKSLHAVMGNRRSAPLSESPCMLKADSGRTVYARPGAAGLKSSRARRLTPLPVTAFCKVTEGLSGNRGAESGW
jgi:hypothetical protein